MTIFAGWLARGAQLRATLLRNTSILLLVALHVVQLVPVPGQPWRKFDPEAGPDPVRPTFSNVSVSASGFGEIPDWFSTGEYRI